MMRIKRRGFIMLVLLAPFSRWLPKTEANVINDYPYTYAESFVASGDVSMFGCTYCAGKPYGFECDICGSRFERLSWPTPKNSYFPTEYVKLEIERTNKEFYAALLAGKGLL